jgi:hypothetical protein
LSGVKVKDLKAALTDIQKECAVYDVLSECELGEFVARKTKVPYHPRDGKAFYQLTKKEKIQPTKEVLVMEKGKKAIYSGNEARTMVGLHHNALDHCTPGNHANYDIFIQSTSSNRLLVRGSKLIYRK